MTKQDDPRLLIVEFILGTLYIMLVGFVFVITVAFWNDEAFWQSIQQFIDQLTAIFLLPLLVTLILGMVALLVRPRNKKR